MDYSKPAVNVPHDVPLGVPSKVGYGTAAMVGIYRRPEILDTDPYDIFRVVYSIQPFLPLWEKKR